MRDLFRNIARNIKFTTRGFLYRRFKDLSSAEAIVDNHFSYWSHPDHPNKEGLKVAITSLNNRASIIVETGTSAYGTDSTRLFDQYVRSFGGRFLSVDINESPSKRLSNQMSKMTELHVSDSVEFLKNLSRYKIEKVDLFYLDSRDVEWEEPEASARHGLEEYKAMRQFLRSTTIIVIDDTPNSMHWIPVEFREAARKFFNKYAAIPGKGAFVQEALEEDGIKYKVLYHEYNLVLQIV